MSGRGQRCACAGRPSYPFVPKGDPRPVVALGGTWEDTTPASPTCTQKRRRMSTHLPPTRRRRICVLLMPPEALARDVHTERVEDLRRYPRLVDRIRGRKRVAAAVDVMRELYRERELALHRRALALWCREEDHLFLEKPIPADTGNRYGRMLARSCVNGTLELGYGKAR